MSLSNSLLPYNHSLFLEPDVWEFPRLSGFLRGNSAPRVFDTPLDVQETPDNITVKADLPGLTTSDINVDVSDGYLTISGSRVFDSENRDPKGNWTRRERSFGRFSRSVSVPRGTTAEDVSASFKDGVLTVNIPRKNTTPPPTRVMITN